MNIDKLIRFNEWWVTNNVKPSLLKPYKRPLFFEIEKYLSKRQILLITGLRRVGKTTLMYQLIQYLLDKNIKNIHVLYFSFDEEIANFDELINAYEEKVLKGKIQDENIFIFLDEVQKCKNWQNQIKIYYDLYPNLKFIISGSAYVQISKKAKESLAGRIFDFLLQPFSFKEFLDFKCIRFDAKNLEISQKEIAPLFYDYLRKGGFPEIIEEENDEKIRNYIKSNVIETIIFKDLPQEFGVRDYELFKTLIEMVASNPGMTINYDALSKNLKKNKTTIIDYFYYLQYSMVFKTISNFRKGFLISSRKMKKCYVANTAISFALVESFYSNSFLEKIAENFAVIESEAKNYYKNRYEIDIILKTKEGITPLEVKFGKVEISQTLKFLLKFNLKKAIILTKDAFDSKTFGDKKILIIPLLAFSIAKEEYLKSSP